ncbi:hypothetical protein Q3G72_033624 [Acer saccharum]|nr:hypothetical protein Q3G72_033624 [Acer saccharum]
MPFPFNGQRPKWMEKYEQHIDVVNLPSSRSESASLFRSGNISSIWVQFQDIPIGKSIQFKFVLKDSTGNMLWQPRPDRIFQTWEQELDNELKQMPRLAKQLQPDAIPTESNVLQNDIQWGCRKLQILNSLGLIYRRQLN